MENEARPVEVAAASEGELAARCAAGERGEAEWGKYGRRATSKVIDASSYLLVEPVRRPRKEHPSIRTP